MFTYPRTAKNYNNKRKVSYTLRNRFILIILIAVLPSLGLVSYSSLERRHLDIRIVRNQALETVKNIAELHDHHVKDAHRILFTLSHIPQIRELDEKGSEKIFNRLMEQTEGFTGFAAANPNGLVFASSPLPAGPINFSDRSWFQHLLLTRSPVTSTYQIGRLSGKPVSVIAYPVLNEADNLQCILSVGLDLDWLNSKFLEPQFPENTTFTVVDHAGTVLIRYPDPKSFVGKIINDTELFKTFVSERSGTAETIGLDGISRLYGFTTLGEGSESLYASIGISKSVAFSQSHRALVRDILLLFLVYFVAVFVMWITGNTFIVKPVKKLLLITRHFAHGDLKARSSITSGKGEFVELAHAFDTMADSLQMRQEERDITEKKLKESEMKFRNIVESIPMGMHMYSCEQDGRLVFAGANPAADRILGINHEELVGKTIEKAFPALITTEVPSKYRDVALEGAIWHREDITYEEGQIKGVFDVSAFRTSPRQMVAAFLDITGRKLMEEELKNSERKYHTIFETAASIIVLIDEKGTILDCNNRAKQILGFAKEEIIGRAISSFLSPEFISTAYKDLKELLASGLLLEKEYRILKKDGMPIDVSVSGSAVRNEEGSYEQVICLLHDISDRKKLQEQFFQAQKMEAVGRLAGGIAHDFNNILTAIIGFSDVLLRRIKKEDSTYPLIKEIKEAGDKAATLTHQFLAFSRKQILQPRVLNINEIMINMEKMLKRVLGEDIEIITKFEQDLGSVKLDPGQIEQVIMNLAVNAKDAMPRGGKLVVETANTYLDEEYSKTHPSATPGHYIMFAVSDTGIGMDSEVKMRIFEPFFTTKKDGIGTGLGLSTVYGIVKQSGGNIWVYSEVGKGTTFKIYFPRLSEKAERYESEEVSDELYLGTGIILVVEDEEMVRRMVSFSLTTLGYEVLMATNGAEALAMLSDYKGKPINLLITDVVLPGMNGRELAEKVRKSNPDLKVLFISGYTDNAIIHHGILDSGVPFLQKPFTMNEIGKKVHEVLKSTG